MLASQGSSAFGLEDLLRIVSAADPNVQGFSKAHMYGVEGRFSFLAWTSDPALCVRLLYNAS